MSPWILSSQGYCFRNYSLSLIRQYFPLYWITPVSTYQNGLLPPSWNTSLFWLLAHYILLIFLLLFWFLFLGLFCYSFLPFPKLYKSWNASSLTLGRAQTRHPSLSILMSFAISFSLIILNFTYMLTTHKITISAHSCAPNTFVTSPFWCPTDFKVNILRLPD